MLIDFRRQPNKAALGLSSLNLPCWIHTRQVVPTLMADHKLDALVYATFDHQPALIAPDVMTKPVIDDELGNSSAEQNVEPLRGSLRMAENQKCPHPACNCRRPRTAITAVRTARTLVRHLNSGAIALTPVAPCAVALSWAERRAHVPLPVMVQRAMHALLRSPSSFS
jgi:hypothetical protein